HVDAAQPPAPALLGPLRADEPRLAEALGPRPVRLAGPPRQAGRPEVHGPLVEIVEAVGPVVLDPVAELLPERLELRPKIELHGRPQAGLPFDEAREHCTNLLREANC